MGEEEKKPDEKKVEEKKDGEEKKPEEEKKEEPKDEKPKEENKETKTEDAKEEPKEPPPPPPPPEEIVLRVYMHCEGCAKKVRRSLRGFEGVEDVQTDCRTRTVVVKGKKAAADPLKVLDRVQRKSHRQVELISPIPKPPEEDAKKDEEKNAKTEEKKEEPQVIIVVLKVYMHCEACAQEIKKRIQKMKGVESADPDLKSSLVTVKGVFDPAKLVEYVYKRTGKRAEIVKQEPEKKEENKEEKKSEGEEKAEKGEGGEKKEEKEEKKEEEKGDAKPKEEGEGEKAGEAAAAEAGEEAMKVELKKNEFLYYYPIPRYAMEYAYPPQIFSDENPNACSVM